MPNQHRPPFLQIVKKIHLLQPQPPICVSYSDTMKTILFSLLSLLFISIASAAEDKGQLRHLVMFKFKADAKAEQIASIEKPFASLPSKIDTITGFEWGTNVSKENKNDGLTHCFFVSFKDQAGLDVYSPHPDHQAFVKELLPILDKVVVVDYIAK